MNFKKIVPIVMGAILLGSTIGFAGTLAAGDSYPNDFASAVVVYGDAAMANDAVVADLIAKDLGGDSTGAVDVSGVTEEDVILGGDVAIEDLTSPLTDSDIDKLLDTSISWDDGLGDEDFNVHEELAFGGSLEIKTTLDNNDFEETVMTVDQDGIVYKYVFEDALNISGISADNTIKLKILGETLEFTDIATNSVTINLAPEVALKEGGTYKSGTKTVTVDSIFTGSVSVIVDGESQIIDKDDSDTVNGIKIEVKDIGYSSDNPANSKAILQIGEDLTKQYDDGDAYIGEDEDDPVWVWELTDINDSTQTIAVKYGPDMAKTVPKDNPAKVGEAYVLPNNYLAVKLDKLEDLSYEDYSLSFDTENLYAYNASDNPIEILHGVEVVILEGEDSESLITGGNQTSKIALYRNSSMNSTMVFALDDDGSNKFELVNTSAANGTTLLIGNITNEDTNIALRLTNMINVVNSTLVLDTTNAINISLQGATTGYNRLGEVAEESAAADIKIGTSTVGTEDNNILDYYGNILKSPDTNTENDVVELSIPEDRVHAQVSAGDVSGGGVVLAVKDTALGTQKSTKNLIVVGGSAVNTIAAELVKCTACSGADWTAATDIGPDMALIKLYSGSDKTFGATNVALLVAGYEAADTEAAAKYLIAHPGTVSTKTLTKTTAGTYA